MSDKPLVGDASRSRVFAQFVDQMLAFLLALAAAGRTPGLSDTQRGLALGLAYLAYFVLFEGLFSTTPGKRVFGLCVSTLDGGKISRRQSIVRNLLRIVEANPLLLGLLPGGIVVERSDRNQRWGDMLAGTLVLRRATAAPSLRGPKNGDSPGDRG